MEDYLTGDEMFHTVSPLVTPGESFSGTKKDETLADSLEAQF
jgi:hypothetical protein